MARLGWRVALAICGVAGCGEPVVAPATDTTSADGPGSSGDPAGSGADAASATSTSGTPPTTGIADDTVGPDSGDDSEGGNVFFPYPDIEPPLFECDLFDQNCPPGHKCMPWAHGGGAAWNATRCSALAPNPVQVGEACIVEGSAASGIDDCDIGLMCWDVDARGMGTCEDMCTGNATAPICENPADVCAIANEGALVLCLPSCDPSAPMCPGAQVCIPVGDDWICAPPGDGGGGTHGEPCSAAGLCEVGHTCVAASAFTMCADAFGCCTAFCDLNDDGADAMCAALDPAQQCEPFYVGEPPEGYEHVGICAIPP